ncbi:MAG: serine/threonine-protein kinase [Thermoguttaceae bacterium]
MKADISTSRHALTTSRGDWDGLASVNRVADAIKRRWRQGEVPNLSDALSHNPELRNHRSIVLDLAYAEYRHRQQAGEPVDAETFAKQFPSLEKSLYLLIEVQGLLSRDPELQGFQEALPWPEAGSRYLQFDLVAEIGRGAFGRVFLATEPAIGGRPIIVKIAPRAGGEADILGKLRHPNIVPIYSFCDDPECGLAAFCMPYFGRATLCDVLEQAFEAGNPPARAQAILAAIAKANAGLDCLESDCPDRLLQNACYVDGVIHLVCQLADALAHSHGRGIYHHDLKPSNVLLAPDGRPLLLDFNLSIDSRLPAWKVGGTLPYMAPEELACLVGDRPQSGVSHYDPRSDLFSLGVISYELLTGVLPFGAIPQGDNVDDIAGQLRKRQAIGPRPIRERNRQVDRRLAQLVESCLAFAPDCRPRTASDLADAFRRQLSFRRRAHRWAGNHRRAVAGTAIIVLSFVLAAALFFSLRPPYSARQFQLGVACIERGKYAAAVDCLASSIRANPRSSEAFFARGRAYQRLGDYRAAYADFNASFRLKPNGLAKACEAYCLARAKFQKDAIAACQLAERSGFEHSAVLDNNIGYSYRMLGQLKEAERFLHRATELDDGLLAPHYNLVVVYLRLAQHSGRIPSKALAHAARATEIGAPNAALYRDAAALYATAAKRDPTQAKPAIRWVAKAIELGCPPKTFVSDVCYSTLWKEPSFQRALKTTASVQELLSMVALIDPLDEP